MARDKRKYENDDVDLTEMISEYGKDNELRRKIDALKKQKEEEKEYQARREQHANRDNDVKNNSDVEGTDEKGIPDIRVDATLVDMPRVHEEEDLDKTLVILGHKKGVSYDASVEIEDTDENKTALFDRNQASAYDREEEDSHSMPTQGLFGYNDEEEEEEEEENEEEYEEEVENEDWEEDEDDEDETEDVERENTTMNKVITYVIIGFVSILVLVIAYFGIMYVLGHFGGDEKSSETPAEPAKPSETPEKEVKKPTVDENTKPKNDINTNTAKIAQLNKQLDTYKKQLDQVNLNLKDARDTVNNTASELAGYETIKKQAEGYKTQAHAAESNVKVAEAAVKTAKAEYEQAESEEAKAQAKIKLDDANAKLQAAQNSVKDLYNLSAIKSEEYASKEYAIRAANEKQAYAKVAIKELNEKKVSLEKNIANVTTEIARLEKE